MGNSGVRSRLDRRSSQFLSSGEDSHKTYLNKFYNEQLQGNSFEKYKILEAIVEDHEEVANLIELPSEHDKMCTQGGFFDSLTEEQATKLYDVLEALQN